MLVQLRVQHPLLAYQLLDDGLPLADLVGHHLLNIPVLLFKDLVAETLALELSLHMSLL